jgi:UDP-3-O-[3-hydroxymyristoyl] glucosamine N-acyltransferase
MADPRFFDNRGPFTLTEVCRKAGVAVPGGADGKARIDDLASLAGAVSTHLSFFVKSRPTTAFSQSGAGFCFVRLSAEFSAPAAMVMIPCPSVQHAFATVAEMFYPESSLAVFAQESPVHATAELGEGVVLAPGVVIGPRAQIGDGTRLGPNAVVGRGVTIGRDCEVGSNVSISHAYLGDRVVVLPGAQIGQPGFGFASGPQGHVKIPQLGRVIVQDHVEIGACVTIDRGALGDTVIGEGTKIDNLVQIGHNVHIGRHCMIVGQCGFAGSSLLGDFVVTGGQAALADHCVVGNGARLAGRTALYPGQELEGGRDYGGMPAKPVKEWIREMHAMTALIKKQKREGDD